MSNIVWEFTDEFTLKLIAENKAKHARGEDARVLDLTYCGLASLPSDLEEMLWVEELILCSKWHVYENEDSWPIIKHSQNRDRVPFITSYEMEDCENDIASIFSNSLPYLPMLKKIRICGTDYIHYSPNFSSLNAFPNLEEISCSNLRDFDLRLIANLKNLKVIDISHTRINDLSPFSEFPHLKILDCNHTHVSDLTPLSKLTNLERLYCSGTSVLDLSPLSKLNKLKIIYIHDNYGQGPSSLTPLSNIKSINTLFINSKNINDLFPLSGLGNLKELSIQSNENLQIEPLSNLVNLEYLRIECKGVVNIDVLSKLTKLTSLTLRNSGIKDLSSLSNLLNLEYLDVSNTKISNLVPLLNLIKLKVLNIENTQISDLSPILPRLKKGLKGTGWLSKMIDLKGCPLEIPPIEIADQGMGAILNYFAERSKQQFKNIEIKLILLGNSTVGKSSLSRYLRDRQFELGQKTTEGIDPREKWTPEGREMQVNIWDFGGQEYYHATHRLFLSRNAVYALVWDAKTDKGGIEPTEIHYGNDPQAYTVPLEHFSKAWWLKNIHFNLNKYAPHEREGEAPIPVLLVQNKCAAGEGYEMQDVPSEFGETPYHLPAKWRNNHIDLAEAASEQANGEQGEWTLRFKLFETELIKTLDSQMATYEFAIYHRDIRDRVRALASGETPVNEMSWTDFEAMCRDIEPDAKMDLVQIYLRDITGDILYFDQNERLRHRVFLRPDWVCNRIYAILSRKIMERKGLFDLAWVCEALQCDNQEALDFVELMREFQLVFAENDENGEPTGNYVAPQYLPDACTKPDKLEAAKEYANLTHAFTLWFPGFLPKSHIARFVAHWGDKAKQRLFWKNGLLFQINGCTALVQHKDEFKIQVDIQTGNHAKWEDAILRIFQSFLDLEDGQAGFAVSLDEKDFVRWRDAQEAIYTQARQVKSFPLEASKYIDIHPFFVFQKPIAMPKKLFISYSHKDEEAMKELDKFLGPLERKGEIEIWTDRKILPGQKWKDEILKALNSADLTLLLVSANFLDSDFINDEEIPRAFQRREAEGKHVVPIILNYCLWDITEISTLQAIPKDGRPIADYPNTAQGWSEVARAISALLKA